MWDVGLAWQVGLLAVATAATAAVLCRLRLGRGATCASAGFLALVALVSALVWTWQVGGRTRSNVQLVKQIPAPLVADAGFVTSGTCRSCHPSQYASWHDSFHRTMTQCVTPESVTAVMDGVTLRSRGREYRLSRRGDEFWVNMVDPDWEHERLGEHAAPDLIADPPRKDLRLVMSTGSHHMQTYWVASERDGRLFNLPFVWLHDDQRWAAREDVFLRPEHYPRQFGTWHDNCIECHSTGGEKHYDRRTGRYDPTVAELGIACEACHGPGGEHVRANRDPARRYRLRLTDAPDPTIVNPRRLDARASSQVCGQCHGIHVYKGREYQEGKRYRPGDSLWDTRMVLRISDRDMDPEERAHWPELERHIQRQTEPGFIENRLWPDGMVRVGGREFVSMSASACYRTNELSCLSCHSLHDGKPVNQLAPGRRGDEGCLQCHDAYRRDIEAHTHHGPDSAGSRCSDCHMPHTAYALLKAIRSHQIDSPTVARELETGRPNACNLCHLDQPLRWTADHLRDWYGQPDVTLAPEQEEIAAGVLWVLKGNANVRALAAWHMGWEPARTTSGAEWITPYLGHLLADPYATVRYIAQRSLRRDPLFAGFRYDFVGSLESRSQARADVLRRWARTGALTTRDRRPSLLYTVDGRLDVARLTRLSRERDDRDMDLRE